MTSKQPKGATHKPQKQRNNNAVVPNALLNQYAYGSEEKKLQVVELKKHLFSRLLYTNPVCLLTTSTNTVPPSLLPSGSEASSSTEGPEATQTNSAEVTPTTFSSPLSPNQLQPPFQQDQDQHQHQDQHQSQPNSLSPPLRNVMAITWLTATTNHGDFIASMNNTRYSAHLMKATRRFVLNVPVAGMEETIRSIGRCSGKDGDKFERLSVPLCAPGWKPLPFSSPSSATSASSSSSSSSQSSVSASLHTASSPSVPDPQTPSHNDIEKKDSHNTTIDSTSNNITDIAIPSCVAHMVCEVVRILEDQVDGHLLLIGKITSAFVRADYWGSANFIQQDDALPPYLTFLGGGNFGYVSRTPPTASNSLPQAQPKSESS